MTACAAEAGPTPRRQAKALTRAAGRCGRLSARSPHAERDAASPARNMRGVNPTWIYLQAAIVLFVLAGMIIAATKLL
ncbi:MAG: hypothetical protein NVS1B9_14540 [Solirubrobacteraceae bacterium]